MVPVGTYKAVAKSVKCDESREKRTPYVRIMFEIQEGTEAGQSVEWTGWLTEKTQERTMETIILTCGWKGNDLSALNDGVMNGIDGDVFIVVEHEDNPDNGKTYAKVRWVNRTERVVTSSLDKPAAVAFADRFKGLAEAVRASNQQKPAPSIATGAVPTLPVNTQPKAF